MGLDSATPVLALGISGSPRLDGNSDRLVKEVLAGARTAGARVELVSLRELSLKPCRGCRSCEETGECAQEDDFQKVRDRMVAADRLVLATPVYFMTVSAQLKLLMDRSQSLWVRKYRLKRPLPPASNPPRLGAAVAVGGSKVKETFTGISLTMRYFFDVFSVARVFELFYQPFDRPGTIRQHPTALADAFALGQVLGRKIEGTGYPETRRSQ